MYIQCITGCKNMLQAPYRNTDLRARYKQASLSLKM
jgi:hypothetical protein